MPLPEELKRAILGARRKILFVEGTNNSLDQPLYSALFSDVSVMPQKSSVDVQRAVKGLRESHNFHDVEAFGLIDRDDLSDARIEELIKGCVFALDVYSVEGLYCCSDVIESIAHLQADVHGCNDAEIIDEVRQKAIDALNQNSIAEEMAARRCERRVRNLIISKLPDWEKIKNHQTVTINEDIAHLYEEELNRFKEFLDEKKLDELFARYRLHKSPVFGAIARALKFQTTKDYKNAVTTQIRKNSHLAQKLKNRISLLSEAMERDAVEVSVT